MSRQILLGPSDTITLFAPQPSSSNAADVVLPYELNGQPGTLIGTVQDNGYVRFTLGNGPANVVDP